MYDASAKIPRVGLLEGHQHFPGNFDSCLEIVSEDFDDIGQFSGKMCMSMGLATVSPQEAERKIKGNLISHMLLSLHYLILETYSMFAFNNNNIRMANVLKNGFVFLGRCIPSVCSMDDLMYGWYNFLNETQIPQDIYTLYPINCHTADETSKDTKITCLEML